MDFLQIPRLQNNDNFNPKLMNGVYIPNKCNMFHNHTGTITSEDCVCQNKRYYHLVLQYINCIFRLLVYTTTICSRKHMQRHQETLSIELCSPRLIARYNTKKISDSERKFRAFVYWIDQTHYVQKQHCFSQCDWAGV